MHYNIIGGTLSASLRAFVERPHRAPRRRRRFAGGVARGNKAFGPGDRDRGEIERGDVSDRPAKNAGRKRQSHGAKLYLPWRDSILDVPIRSAGSIRKDAFKRR